MPPRPGALPVTDAPTSPRPGRQRWTGHWWRLAALAALLALAGWRLADAWGQTARREASLPQLEAMARRSPGDGPTLTLLGARRAEAHQPTAPDVLRRAIVAGEQSEAIWLTLAATTAAGGDRTRALADLRLGLHALGTAPRLQEAQARADALGPTPTPDALAQAIAPDGPAPLVRACTQGSFLNGLSRWWGHRFPERSGFATREEWARQEPANAQAQRLWGEALVQNDRLPEAGAALARAVDLAPRSPAARLAFADALQSGGFGEKAGLEYIECLKLRPDWLPALLGLGGNALDARLSHAAPAFRRATQVAPQSVDAWIGLGRASLVDSADNAQARAAFAQAARLAPERTDFFAFYAQALRREPRLAEPLLRRRLRDAPGDAQCRYLLAQALMNSVGTASADQEAEAEVREALRLSPRQPLAETLLAEILLRRGQATEAVALLQDARKALPYDVTLLNVLTRAARQAGDAGLAAATAAQSAQVFRDQQQVRVLEVGEHGDLQNLGLHRQLAELHARIGDTTQAERERTLIRLLQADPQKVRRDQQALHDSLHQVLPGQK